MRRLTRRPAPLRRESVVVKHQPRQRPAQLADLGRDEATLEDTGEGMTLPQALTPADEDAARGCDFLEESVVLSVGRGVRFAA